MKTSAGILVYRKLAGKVEVLLVHPGGPFWAKKDEGAWSIPKGEYAEGDAPQAAAKREFQEEIGQPPPEGEWLELGEVTQSNKKVLVWAVEGDIDLSAINSNTFAMEWPPRSGTMQEFPEIDRAAWFSPDKAAQKVVPAQAEFFERLTEKLGLAANSPPPAQGSLF